MAERALPGTPASPGVALGKAWRPREAAPRSLLVPAEDRECERDRALEALAASAAELRAVAASMPAEEAEIVRAGALMAEDPALARTVQDAILADGHAAAEAIVIAAGEYADAIAALGDQTLAARADDVRSLGRRAGRLAAGSSGEVLAPPGGDLILIARDLGPADVAELAPSLAAIALAGGGATAHAAIVARSLGLPMLTGMGEPVLEIADGTELVLDGIGSLFVDPSAMRARAAAAHMSARRRAARRAHEQRDQPAITTDGQRITVLANVASAEELGVGLRAGAEGIGLLRTELAFLDASEWPSEQEHTEVLMPILAGLGDRRAIVRVLDFGADKSPPFLRSTAARGLELLLAHTEPFVQQLRAILLAAQRHEVWIMLPMVDTLEQLTATRALLDQTAHSLGVAIVPRLGSMIETPAAVEAAAQIATASDFLSIGTNDLTAATLGADRFAVNKAATHHPRVLRSIAASVTAAHDAGIRIEVCGEAASDAIMVPLLVGLGVDELSVGAARVGEIRDWIRKLDSVEAAGLARSALTMDNAEEVRWAASPLATELQRQDHGAHALGV